jgi:hypothetical protein
MMTAGLGARRSALGSALLATMISIAVPGSAQQAPDWRVVEETLGRAGAAQAGGVMKFGFPRTDLTVMVGDVRIRPALALGGWVAFMPNGGGVIAMGDLVLTTTEVAPVMRSLEDAGVEVMAVHNHLIGETPRLVYMHIMALGDAGKIAATLRSALALTGTPLTAPPPAQPEAFPLDTVALTRALGAPGRVNGGVWQVSVARGESIMVDGVVVPPAMGLATVINIQPLDGGRAAATGDFVLTGAQVTPVMRALTSHGIAVTALHSHLMASQPALLFMHFWAVDSTAKVAAGLGAALAAAKP